MYVLYLGCAANRRIHHVSVITMNDCCVRVIARCEKWLVVYVCVCVFILSIFQSQHQVGSSGPRPKHQWFGTPYQGQAMCCVVFGTCNVKMLCCWLIGW